MLLNIYIKRVSGDEAYVHEPLPLTYSSVKRDAMRIEYDFDIADADYFEDKVWKPLNTIIDQSGIMDWRLTFETAEEALLADVITSAVSVAIAVSDATDAETARAIRELCSNLADYLMSKALERAASATVTAPSDTDASVSDGSSLKTAASSEDSLEELVKAVEAKTKASITKPKETLADYVCDGTLKEELEEIKDFFENRKTYHEAGIKLPKGILFKGVPGTGKTYAARCIAGSVDCYFMSCTASSLQGMYIGSGAENVRNLFNGAKVLYEKSGKGVIVFIDELDSFGSRANHNSSSSGEEDRTLNQLLAEMSGFEDADGVMVLGATNYPERIDDALMRSGRFSRQITINVPSEVERLGMVKYYFSKLKMKFEEDCDEATVAALTAGLTPADISEVTNEAGILTIRAKKSIITLDEMNEAINKVITKNIRKPDKSKDFHKRVAGHEAGHVLAEWAYDGEFSIKVTNFSYGDAGGFTQPHHSEECLYTRTEYKNSVMRLLGGRAAEEVLFCSISVGASEDFARALKRIRAYYETYHFEPYDVEKLDQIAHDTLHTWYEECVVKFRCEAMFEKLKNLTDKLIAQRVLYTKDIVSIITR